MDDEDLEQEALMMIPMMSRRSMTMGNMGMKRRTTTSSTPMKKKMKQAQRGS